MDSLIEWMIEHLTFKVGSLSFPHTVDLFTTAILFVTRGGRLWGWPDSKLLKMEKSKPGLGQETTLRPINGQFKKKTHGQTRDHTSRDLISRDHIPISWIRFNFIILNEWRNSHETFDGAHKK